MCKAEIKISILIARNHQLNHRLPARDTLSRKDRNPCPHLIPPSLLPSLLASLPPLQLRPHRQLGQPQLPLPLLRLMVRTQVWWIPQISTAEKLSVHVLLRSKATQLIFTSCKSLPLSSLSNFSKRSSSASIPTDSKTPLISSADGEVLPPKPRSRYAARCFMLFELLCSLSFMIEPG